MRGDALIVGIPTLEQRLALLPHVLAVAEAVAYAHSRRIIHRDLKPDPGELRAFIAARAQIAVDLDPPAP